MIDIGQLSIYVVTAIGGFTLIFRGLAKLAELTKSEKDDIFIKKVLNVLIKVSEFASLNKKK